MTTKPRAAKTPEAIRLADAQRSADDAALTSIADWAEMFGA